MRRHPVRACRNLLLALFAAACVSGCAGYAYGCWCGEGVPPAGESPRPVDRWDAACRSHDRCYDRRGQGHPGCDADFLGNLNSLYQQYGYMPGQLQIAYSHFASRLNGRGYWVQGWVSPSDLGKYLEAGRKCE